jgi:hypothetical protein
VISLAALALQPFIMSDLITLTGRVDDMMLSDTIIAPMASFDLDFDDASKSIVLDFRVAEPITSSLSSEFCRLSSAALQSALSIDGEIDDRDRIAWAMIKLYYSAFYAGHALIRLFGGTCSYFGRAHTMRLMELGSARGKTPAFKLDSGFYNCTVKSAGTAMTCIKVSGSSGGAHDAFWDTFQRHIKALSAKVLNGPMIPIDAQAVFAQLHAFTTLTARQGNLNWLSGIRNDLQYRHRHDVWFPFAVAKRERQSLGRTVAQWMDDPMQISLSRSRIGPLGDFCSACAFVVALCRAMLARLSALAPQRLKSFVYFGPVSFLNYAKLSRLIGEVGGDE